MSIDRTVERRIWPFCEEAAGMADGWALKQLVTFVGFAQKIGSKGFPPKR